MLKTIKKYVSSSVTKLLCNITMDYAIFSPEYLKNVDEMLIDINNTLLGVKQFCQPYKSTLNPVTDWTIGTYLDCTIIANVCYVQGIISHGNKASSGGYDLDIFPDGIKPKYEIKDWSPIIIDGVEYKTHIEITPSDGRLQLFFYDEIPANKSIPINLVFPLTTDFVG